MKIVKIWIKQNGCFGSLKSESFRDFLIKHSEAGFNMSSQKGDPKSREFKNLKKAFEGINNDRN